MALGRVSIAIPGFSIHVCVQPLGRLALPAVNTRPQAHQHASRSGAAAEDALLQQHACAPRTNPWVAEGAL